MSTNPPRRRLPDLPPHHTRRPARWDEGGVSPKQAAAFTGLTTIHILRAMRAGKLDYSAVPGSRNKVIPVVSLKRYLEKFAVDFDGECDH